MDYPYFVDEGSAKCGGLLTYKAKEALHGMDSDCAICK